MRKTKVVSLILVMMLISIIVSLPVQAVEVLGINVNSQNQAPKKDEEITVTVKLSEGMQATDFYLEYDNDLLEYVETEELKSYMGVKDGKLVVAWFSSDNTDRTEFNIKFKTKEYGEAVIKLVPENFATGKLEKATSYNVTYGDGNQSEGLKIVIDNPAEGKAPDTGEKMLIVGVICILGIVVVKLKKNLNAIGKI